MDLCMGLGPQRLNLHFSNPYTSSLDPHNVADIRDERYNCEGVRILANPPFRCWQMFSSQQYLYFHSVC